MCNNLLDCYRTEGISSSELRIEKRRIRLGMIGESHIINKFIWESKYVNGLRIVGIYTEDKTQFQDIINMKMKLFDTVDELLKKVDAVYIISAPHRHYYHIKKALESKKHVLCEAPIALKRDESELLFELAANNNCILMESTKTAYAMAYHRMLLLIKTGIIGNVVSINATCTSIRDIHIKDPQKMARTWNSISAWGPTAMLPVFQILGTRFRSKSIITQIIDKTYMYDSFTKIDFYGKKE